MKKTILSLLVVGTAMTVTAQIAEVSKPEPILRGVESEMFNPVLSADGKYLMFSDANYTNVRRYEFESGAVSKVDLEPRRAVRARICNDGTVATETNSVRTEGSTLYITVNGVEKAYSPVESFAGYIWASLSPDGKKVMFFAAGHGIVITDLEGNIVAEPGNFEAPVWYGNDYIVAQNATDDGHQYHSSQILLMNLDGSEKQAITRPESMTFTPAASLQGRKIVYSTIDGRLYMVNVELK